MKPRRVDVARMVRYRTRTAPRTRYLDAPLITGVSFAEFAEALQRVRVIYGHRP